MAEDATITVEHRGPLRPTRARSQAALLVAFPSPQVMRVPRDGEPVGRRWLEANGIADRKVSGAHASFRHASGVFVTDAGSRNGTFINGVPLVAGAEQRLRDGDVLRMGNTLAVYRSACQQALPHPPLGQMVAPFGLEQVRRTLDAMVQNPPRNVLIEGETGTGKELAARAVASHLGRADPYVAVNMASVPAGVFEAQLFGHTAGAFSGAGVASEGLIIAHEGGAVCLDELGELPLEMQPKLLRLLENREVQQVGGLRPVAVDVLLIATTNRDLRQLAARGDFRLDLVARLSLARLILPPLRERREDIFHIAKRLQPTLVPEQVEVEAAELLLLQDWPTNVRGIAALLAEVRTVDAEPGLRVWALEQVLAGQRASAQKQPEAVAAARPEQAPLKLERVQQVLAACNGNETRAAKHLGVSRGKLRRFLSKQ